MRPQLRVRFDLILVSPHNRVRRPMFSLYAIPLFILNLATDRSLRNSFQAVSVMFFAWISDKHRHRALFIVIQTVITLVGLFITGFASSAGWRYAGMKICFIASFLSHLLAFRHFLEQCRFCRMYTWDFGIRESRRMASVKTDSKTLFISLRTISFHTQNGLSRWQWSSRLAA